MKKFILVIIFTIVAFNVFAQSVVRMKMPLQPAESLKVLTLYDESLPVNTTVVLGAIGYDITGGTTPYSFAWLKDNQVIASGDVAVFQPVAGSTYSLKVTDRNNCTFVTPIHVNAPNKVKIESGTTPRFSVSPTIVTDKIQISVDGNRVMQLRVRIFDMRGKLAQEATLVGSTELNVKLATGNYFVVIEGAGSMCAEKIIVK